MTVKYIGLGSGFVTIEAEGKNPTEAAEEYMNAVTRIEIVSEGRFKVATEISKCIKTNAKGYVEVEGTSVEDYIAKCKDLKQKGFKLANEQLGEIKLD